MIKTVLVASTALVALAGLAFAQDANNIAGRAAIYESIPALAKDPAPPVAEFVGGQARLQLLATDFMGLPVHDTAGTELGTIDDVLFDEGGKLSVIVLNVSELVGAEKRIAFNLSNLRQEPDNDNVRLVAAIDRTKIDAAPNFTSLAEEMSLNDGQSLTADEAKGGAVTPPGN